MPNRVLWGNGRTKSQRYRSILTKEHRKTAHLCALGHNIDPPMIEARCDLRCVFSGHARRDAQNLIHAVKAYIDGLEDAGVIKNDHGISWGDIDQEVGVAEKALEYVVITLTETGEVDG